MNQLVDTGNGKQTQLTWKRNNHMRILKEGTLPPAKVMFRGECPICNCQVEAREEEVYSTSYGTSYVKCPTNGCWNDGLIVTRVKSNKKLIEVNEKEFTKQIPIAPCTDDNIMSLKDMQVIFGPGPLDEID